MSTDSGGTMASSRNSRQTGWGATQLTSLVVLLALIALIRACIVAEYATEMPFWDQWDAEVDRLYRPYAEGTLRWSDLLAAHNEHRILFTRLLGLCLFALNELQFDNVVTSFTNVLIYVAVFGLFTAPLWRELRSGSLLSFGVAGVLFGGLPYAWENIATGFQNSFFILTGWTVLSLRHVCSGKVGRWWSIALLGGYSICSVFSMASGCLTALATGIVALAAFRSGALPLRRLVVLEIVLALIFGLGIYLIPEVQHTGAMRAQSAAEFLTAAVHVLSWPIPVTWAFVFVWWPVGVWAFRWASSRAVSIPGLDLYLLGIAVWVALQVAAIAYSRGHGGELFPPSRYADLLALGLATNLALATRLIHNWQPHRHAARVSRSMLAAGNVVTLAACLACLAVLGFHGLNNLGKRRSDQLSAERIVAEFLREPDVRLFDGVQQFQLSYPNRHRLAGLLLDPVIAGMMPAAVGRKLSLEWPFCPTLVSPGSYPTTPAHPAGSMGTYSTIGNPNMGACTSEAIHATRSHVRISISGYLGLPGLSLALQATDGAVIKLQQGGLPAAETWRAVHAAVPAAGFALVATDANPDFWYAFTPPREEGRLSAAAFELSTNLKSLMQRIAR